MKRESQPFVVKSEHAEVLVLGTSFNVNSYALKTVKITLAEGAVAFQSAGSQLRLAPGEALTYNENRRQKIGAQRRWDNTPLGDIRELVKRWYNVELEFDDPATANERFTGTIFKNEPLGTFLKTLELTSGIKYHYDQSLPGYNSCGPCSHVRLRGGENYWV